jgi:hypothetical protein
MPVEQADSAACETGKIAGEAVEIKNEKSQVKRLKNAERRNFFEHLIFIPDFYILCLRQKAE